MVHGDGHVERRWRLPCVLRVVATGVIFPVAGSTRTVRRVAVVIDDHDQIAAFVEGGGSTMSRCRAGSASVSSTAETLWSSGERIVT